MQSILLFATLFRRDDDKYRNKHIMEENKKQCKGSSLHFCCRIVSFRKDRVFHLLTALQSTNR